MTNFVYVLGTAGSGKSTLVSALSDYLEKFGKYCITVNLDPGAEVLSYEPVVDIRNHITLEEVMQKYKLGPNGALIVATDLIVNYLPEVKKIIADENPDYVLVDTPGQLELFAFRETGPAVISSFSTKNSLILFLIDAFLAQHSYTFTSLLLLSASIQARFLLPYLLILSKSDLLSTSSMEKIIGWSEDLSNLQEDLENETNVFNREIALNLIPLISNLSIPSLIPVSSITMSGFIELYAEMQRILGKEDEVSLEE
ncbi:MAG: ATP/GTP-binding protein [Thermoproteota archaeon]|jgi:GTPase SAR1 family protein|nr:ATP/GTP-binding protein [Thermoproteota archaeon]